MTQRFEIELDDQGRLVLPSPLPRQLGLSSGMTLVVEQATADAAYLQVQSEQPQLIEKQGVLVIQAELVGEFTDPVRQERDQRATDLLQLVGL
jgi:bifunctional DNA-binding transcriptional regulator/antitoxin component of YhaV-PrlF toxin-antitoxin module